MITSSAQRLFHRWLVYPQYEMVQGLVSAQVMAQELAQELAQVLAQVSVLVLVLAQVHFLLKGKGQALNHQAPQCNY